MHRRPLALILGLLLPVVSGCTAVPPSGADTGSYSPAAPGSCHLRGDLPDPGCTPGAADDRVTQDTIGTTICRRGYTATVRPPVSVTGPIKTERMAAYGESGVRKSDIELDHLIPLELGGASTVANLWPEPRRGPLGAATKDELESALNARVCSGSVTLAAAQQAIASNWEAAYARWVGPLPAGATPDPG